MVHIAIIYHFFNWVKFSKRIMAIYRRILEHGLGLFMTFITQNE